MELWLELLLQKSLSTLSLVGLKFPENVTMLGLDGRASLGVQNSHFLKELDILEEVNGSPR